ncbi:hypothetical protein FQA47_005058 [Oryzias melastigma]|uniref:Uncharacterized protein n=1 Tax=Oryzias melastigma TaxID=30732 RepID=A0A834FTZ8_ORYME|nr:hypothetical protein FQA47_005058 [Oryzias melastigma]
MRLVKLIAHRVQTGKHILQSSFAAHLYAAVPKKEEEEEEEERGLLTCPSSSSLRQTPPPAYPTTAGPRQSLPTPAVPSPANPRLGVSRASRFLVLRKKKKLGAGVGERRRHAGGQRSPTEPAVRREDRRTR